MLHYTYGESKKMQTIKKSQNITEKEIVTPLCHYCAKDFQQFSDKQMKVDTDKCHLTLSKEKTINNIRT